MLYVSSLASIAAASARSPTAQFPLEPNTILTPSQSLTLDSIPLLGFGTSDLDTRNASEAVSWAIQVGYRHIDCDPAYKNQDLVGKGIADGLNKTGLRREDLLITSKLQSRQYVPQSLFLTTNPPSQQLTTSTPSYKTQKKVTQSLTTTLHALQLSYLDLYHLPYAATSPHKPHHLPYERDFEMRTKENPKKELTEVQNCRVLARLEELDSRGLKNTTFKESCFATATTLLCSSRSRHR
jgi:diketogulonate reductase-like aldo/keto reductase